MNAHTPGPWRALTGSIPRVYRNEQRLADLTRTLDARIKGTTVDREADANAFLMAAAPDLLDACKSAEYELSAIMREFREPRTSSDADVLSAAQTAFDAVHAAIAKAEGRT
jgi:hypothetical protein